MHDLNYFRDHLDVFAAMAEKRGTPLHLDAFRVLDAQRRELITATEQLKAQRNKASDEIARLKKAKENADSLIGEMKAVSERIKEADERIAQLNATQSELMLTIPNVPHESVPVGHSAEENVEVRRWGAAPKFDFVAKPHWEVGERAGILDLSVATKITGARFAVYKSWGARLGAGFGEFLFGCAYAGAWVYGDFAAVFGEYGFVDGSGTIAEVCGGFVSRGGNGFLVDADFGSGAAQFAPRRDDCGREAADLCDGVDGVLSERGGGGWERYARDFAAAPVSEGGAV